MPTSTELQVLYQRFDRLIDLPLAEQTRELDTLRRSGDPLALQLEGMLIYHQHQNPTESLFSVQELLTVVQSELPWRIAADLRELSSRLRWDPGSRSFQLGHFSFFGCLSVSAIGATYHARDLELDRDVVLLLLYPRWSSNHEVQQRSLDACRTVAKIFDPHVAAILGTMNIEGIFAVVRQWIPGMNLDQCLARLAPLSMEQLLLIARGIASGLHSIHEEKVLHGDLKPANIILRKDTLHPVITDFGTATWISPTDSTKWHGGTKGFVAPEILRNESPSPQSDLYSLGVILQWMATGVFDRESTEDDWARARKRLLGDDVGTESLRGLESLRALVSSLLAPNPAQRPRDARMVVDRLAQCRDPGSLPNEFDQGAGEKSRSLAGGVPQNRRRWMHHAVGMTLTAAGATWGGGLLAKSKADREKVFVPGTPSSLHKDLLVTPLVREPRLGLVPKSMYRSLPQYEQGYGFRPRQRGQWEWLEVERIELPDPPYQIGLMQFTLIFDLDPGQAFYRVERRIGPPINRWHLLAEGTNLFGGLYSENILVHLGPELLEGFGPIHARLGIKYERQPRYKTDLPPIAVRLQADTPPFLAGSFAFWKHWDSKPVNVGG